jgi:putative flippase GtrA
VGFLDRPLVRKLWRYSLTSIVGTIVGQGSLIALSAGLGWPGVPANLTAVTLGAIPNYLINRYWTWQKTGPNRLATEVLPFWIMTILGLVLSTLFVAYADDRWGTTTAIVIASTSGFALLWVAKFIVLDRLLFRVEQVVLHELEHHIHIHEDEDEDDGDAVSLGGAVAERGGEPVTPRD